MEVLMGVTLHYRGKLKSPALIEPLVTEVGALAQEAGWQCEEFGPEPYEVFENISFVLRGIGVKVHPKCEMLSLMFDEHGRSVSLAGLEMTAGYGFLVETEDDLGALVTLEMPSPEKLAALTWDDLAKMQEINTAFTKTQFAGAETHILLCKLLRYLEKKYFAELEVFDEGNYYHTGDASKLTEKMAFLNYIIQNAANAPTSENASLEERLQDLTRYLEALAQNALVKPRE
jgi:hypothetical protein